MAESQAKKPIRGRCVAVAATGEITLRNRAGSARHPVENSRDVQPGDWIEIDGGRARVLTRPLRPGESTYLDHVLDPRRLHAAEVRARIERLIQSFFLSRDFVETRTPLLVPSPGMEIHVRPFELKTGAYLPTSPEFAMKRLLAGGLEKIFQICPAFRLEPHSTTHHPEFTMLEWYRAYASVEDIMRDTEELFEFVALSLFGNPELEFEGRRISVKTPWPRLRVRDLFRDTCDVDLVRANTAEALAAECRRLGLKPAAEDTWDDLYFRIWLNCIEPRLPADQAVFVTRYPASQSALAVIDEDPDGSRWAKRFELYAGGLELGNAFEELTDAREQRARFVKDMAERVKIYGAEFPATPLDEGFLRALEEGMPPAGGIAVGVDRMVMLFGNEPDIAKTRWLPSQAHGSGEG